MPTHFLDLLLPRAEKSYWCWRRVFTVAGLIFVAGGLAYVLLG